jgi:hypothetical protein
MPCDCIIDQDASQNDLFRNQDMLPKYLPENPRVYNPAKQTATIQQANREVREVPESPQAWQEAGPQPPQQPAPFERAAIAVEAWASQGSTTIEKRRLENTGKNRWDTEYNIRRGVTPRKKPQNNSAGGRQPPVQ